MFTLVISCLATSNLPWFMDPAFQVPMQYWSVQQWTLPLSPVTSTSGCCFSFGSVPSSFWMGTYRPGEFIFQCPIFLPFHTVHRVLKARILRWLVSPFSNGPHSFKPLHHNPSIFGGPTWHGLVSSVWSDWLFSMYMISFIFLENFLWTYWSIIFSWYLSFYNLYLNIGMLWNL